MMQVGWVGGGGRANEGREEVGKEVEEVSGGRNRWDRR
jgi:hypothetical protein